LAEMKRRTLRKVRATSQRKHHHNVYVVLLDPAVGKLRKVRAANPNNDPKKPCVYVGMPGLDPQTRFANHKAGMKAASVVKKYFTTRTPARFASLISPMTNRRASSSVGSPASTLKVRMALITWRSTFCTSCRCRRGTGRCGQSSARG